MSITDTRQAGKNKSVGNRQKFIKRYKQRIKRSVDDIADSKGITDVLKDRKVVINNDEIEEPNFHFDPRTGERDVVLPGNRTKQKGDRIYNDESEDSGTGGSEDGEGTDQFSFVLTKEEFLDLYFSDMRLPDFIKESLAGSNKYKLKRTGYSKDGIPPRLDLVKTLKQAMARRIATKSKRYLDDIDLRYKHFTKKPFPVKQATMILLMDVSGSMGEYEKMIAKKFFLLLYLFLHKVYKNVEVIFVAHTQDAKEVDEQEFFYGKETGGTIVSSGLKLVSDIIDSRINLESTNVYIAQASDGDNWEKDNDMSEGIITKLLSQVQYMAYIQTEHPDRVEMKGKYGVEDIMTMYEKIAANNPRLQARHVTSESEVYPVLRSLFEKE
jgi:uncharacterized sporulation protein YeaH/YhbH (DUF444 family)